MAHRKIFMARFGVEVRKSCDWWTLSVKPGPERVTKLDLKEHEAEGESSLTFERQGQRICLSFDGWHLDASAAYDESGEDITEGLAELGLELRAELYAGKTAALKVMGAYYSENRIPANAKSPVARKLAALLEVI